ncbi:outer membrane exchange protein TraA family protein [Myxococcaceae bacterium GXIMD 01537]
MFSLPFRYARIALPVLLVCLAGTAGAQKLPDVVVDGPPAAPSPSEPGTGLCVASNVWTKAKGDLPQTRDSYPGQINTYMEALEQKPSRVTSVFRHTFDLSNNLRDALGNQWSYGDFENAVAGCNQGGCGFFNNTTNTTFVSRFRGYLNVTPDMVERPLHFGFYLDDATSFVIYDGLLRPYQVINRPPDLGFPTWHSTNIVTFRHSGLYPIEIVYTQIGAHAALEMSTYDGTFTDHEWYLGDPPVLKLSDVGFQLVPADKFFQTETGRPSFENLDQCVQCNRFDANQPGNGGCGANSGFYCNGAALCAPCDTATKCGPGCSPCGPSTPNCVNVNSTFTCVECVNDTQCKGVCNLDTNACLGECKADSDCPNGRCDPTDHMCRGCNDDADCPSTGRCDVTTNTCSGCNDDGDCRAQGLEGFVCDVPAATCVRCTADEHCPTGQVCATELRECRECNQDADCERGESCSNHQCNPCASNDSCAGASCNCCPGNTQCASPTPGAPPSCVECTNDSQCANGKKCDTTNGRCVDTIAECNTADRCGPACVRCPGERPICLDGQVCVECRNDLECADGKFCLSGECASCTTDRHCGERCGACGQDAPFCLTDGTVAGSSCVQCRSNEDCGSGSCNPATHTCEATNACAVSCAEGLVCNGSTCVECFVDAHCPCGGTCDASTNTCSSSCEDSSDCLGVEHCSASTQQCERGRRKPGTEPRGGSFCCGTPADLTPPGSIAALALLTVAILLRPRRAR